MVQAEPPRRAVNWDRRRPRRPGLPSCPQIPRDTPTRRLPTPNHPCRLGRLPSAEGPARAPALPVPMRSTAHRSCGRDRERGRHQRRGRRAAHWDRRRPRRPGLPSCPQIPRDTPFTNVPTPRQGCQAVRLANAEGLATAPALLLMAQRTATPLQTHHGPCHPHGAEGAASSPCRGGKYPGQVAVTRAAACRGSPGPPRWHCPGSSSTASPCRSRAA